MKPMLKSLSEARLLDHIHVKDVRWGRLTLRIELDDYIGLLVKTGCFYRLEL